MRALIGRPARDIRLLVPLLLVFAWASSEAAGDVLFDNGSTDFISGNSGTLWVAADDFTLGSQGLITGVEFDLLESAGDQWTGAVEWWIFENVFDPAMPIGNRNRPGDVLSSGLAAAIEEEFLRSTSCGTDPCEWSHVAFTLDLPVLLPGGERYWLGLHLDDSFENTDLSVAWASSSQNDSVFGSRVSRNGTFDNWEKTNVNLAFALHGVFDPPVVDPLGDMDFDGDRDFDDIDDFVLGLTNASVYVDLYAVPPDVRGDIDGSGFQDFDDIDEFVAILNAPLAIEAQAIPEPFTFVLAAIGLFGLVVSGCRGQSTA